MMRHHKIGFALVLSALLVASSSFAQGGAGAKPAAAGGGGGGDKGDGYGYEFSDDPLSAGGFGPNDATIRVRPGPVRTTLIRPRTSFVPEMLKSVENL
ncbi:MAG TPA: hypothetical protein VGI39_24000 [Polyangiaceae bacterium]|jgi:hypothetical protein